jgi:hypothetical protein
LFLATSTYRSRSAQAGAALLASWRRVRTRGREQTRMHAHRGEDEPTELDRCGSEREAAGGGAARRRQKLRPCLDPWLGVAEFCTVPPPNTVTLLFFM